ncbi:MAG: small conductance mechanosensitive channel [Cognaticolwellia sp.]|jgi:small conductance mechanosensitive channel
MLNFLLLMVNTAFAQEAAPTAAIEAAAAAPGFDDMDYWMDKGIEVGTNVLIAIVTLIIGWMIAGWIQKLVISQMTKRDVDVSVSRFLGSIVRYMLIAATLIAALAKVGVETTSVIAILGSAGLAIGLALQGSLGNFASGVMILFFRPFQVGHVVEAAGSTGMVKDIGLFATTMQTPSGETIIIPNSAITGGSITNYATHGKRRAHIDVGVDYGTDITVVSDILAAAARDSALVLEDPDVAVVFVNLGASSIDFTVMVWVEWADWIAVQGDVRTRCYDALNKAHIGIPYQTITLVKD